MKRLIRILLGLAAALLIVVVAFAAFMMADAFAGSSAASVSNTTFTAADGTEVVAYLAQPEEEGTYPAVIMVHEWWGLNAEIVEMAEKLAAEGYVVLAPDTYRGRVADTVPGAIALRVSAPVERVNADMQAAYDYLAGLPGVDPTRIAVMGFCYGGGVALRHALENPAIRATINLYGDTVDTPDGFGELLTSGSPVLGIFGEQDAQIPVAEVKAFEAALGQTDIPHTVTIYPGVGHAFVNPETIAAGGAAAEAWAQILEFLDGSLRTGSEPG